MLKFDEDYFENGKKTGKSLYEDYHWMPERSFKEAHAFITHFAVDRKETILDFGCAKGYFVKAARLLGYEAYGYDISEYAISASDLDTRPYLFNNPFKGNASFGFCKDVLEHCENKEALEDTLALMVKSAVNWLIIVPLGDGLFYNVPEYELDLTHHLKYTAEQWLDVIGGFIAVCNISHKMVGIKDNWAHCKNANLFITGVGGV